MRNLYTKNKMCKEAAKNLMDTGCKEHRAQETSSLFERNTASLENNVGRGVNNNIMEGKTGLEGKK